MKIPNQFGPYRIREDEEDDKFADNIDRSEAPLDQQRWRVRSRSFARIRQHLADLLDQGLQRQKLMESIRFSLWLIVILLGVIAYMIEQRH